MRLSPRTSFAVAAASLVAVGLLVWGAALPDNSYGSSLLANLGTTLLLALPLVMLERMITQVRESTASTAKSVGEIGQRVDDVQSSVATVKSRLDQMSEDTETAINTARQRDVDAAEGPGLAAAESPSVETVAAALEHGRETGATEAVVYVGLPEHELTLAFRSDGVDGGPRVVQVGAIPDDRDAKKVACTWRAGESVPVLFNHLDERIRAVHGAAAPVLDPQVVFRRLGDTLRVANRRKQDAGSSVQLYPVKEMPTEHWLVTDLTLEHVKVGAASFPAWEVLRDVKGPPHGQLAKTPDAGELAYAWPAAFARHME